MTIRYQTVIESTDDLLFTGAFTSAILDIILFSIETRLVDYRYITRIFQGLINGRRKKRSSTDYIGDDMVLYDDHRNENIYFSNEEEINDFLNIKVTASLFTLNDLCLKMISK